MFFKNRNFIKSDGWYWYGECGTPDGKYIVEDSPELIQQYEYALRDAVDRGLICCIKFPIKPTTQNTSVLIAFFLKRQLVNIKGILTAVGIQKMFLSWDNRDITEIKYDRGYHRDENYLLTKNGQIELYTSFVALLCRLL